MFEILMFLFENYMNGSVISSVDNETIVTELERIGFERFQVDRALHWLDGLHQSQVAFQSGAQFTSNGVRYYLPEEIERLSKEGIGLLIQLEKTNILDPATRETVIDRLMVLDPREINIGKIKWVVLIALFNQPEKRAALLLMQDMILAAAFNVTH